MTTQTLLRELQARGLLDAAQVEKLKKETLLTDRSLESILNERKLIPDEQVAAVKAEVLGVPYEKADIANVPAEVIDLIPEETVRTYGVMPISRDGDTLIVGMMNPDDVKAQEALKFIARNNHIDLSVYLVSYDDWQGALRRYSPFKSNIEAAVQSLRVVPGEVAGRKTVRLDQDLAKGSEDAPVIKIVADTFKEAVESQASDIHIEPQENELRVRFRVDGDLREVASLPVELSQPVISRVKVISSLKLDETRTPQDGRFRAKIGDRDIDFRVATFPTPLGEKIAIRILDPTVGLRSFDALGLLPANLEKVQAALAKPFGMILITGPTGSGKTTTLYALLDKLNSEKVNIVSLEDPVEYFVSGLNQSQVRPEIGYDFASGLRQILRQDPDVIMVGEIRDRETAALAVQAALTGHIVLSTLHTNNAAGVVPRLLDMGVDSYLIPVSLNMIVSQRLVGLLCPSCKKGSVPSKNLAEVISKALSTMPASAATEKFESPYTIYHATGCKECKGRGTVGRMALYEVLQITDGINEIIANSPTVPKIMKEARAQGMITMREDGIIKALKGIVSLEEVIRSTEDM